MRSTFLAALVFFFGVVVMASAADDLATKCSGEFQKVTMCLPFATAKAASPTKECCGAVTDLRASDPGCLCFIIQQVHNGTNAAVKSMGVQESRLIQLPSACKLVNASITECPRLLNLPPNSPDAAIFTNSSAAATTTPVATPGTSSPTTTANTGFWLKPRSVFVAVAMFFLAYLSGFTST